MTNKRVLLVDDDQALRDTLGEQLDLHDEFETVRAANDPTCRAL